MEPKLRWILANMANATPAGNTIPQDPKGAFTAARSRAGRHRSVNQNRPPAEPHHNHKGGPCVMHLSDRIMCCVTSELFLHLLAAKGRVLVNAVCDKDHAKTSLPEQFQGLASSNQGDFSLILMR